jgi:UDP-N-acetyl-2-amino-2-deoxyglucuronate dehydrogenase
MNKRPTFILIGAAGYVAPRHMEAIRAVGGELVAAVDQRDSVGILDHYAPKCAFYKNWYDVKERADYVVICTPNNTHAVSAYWALDSGMDVILEKPACIRMKNLRELQDVEKSTGKKVNCILQMRLHPEAITMRNAQILSTWRVVHIDYHTPRGPWYFKSWKAEKGKSGGILFNIGIHLFDLAISVFGKPTQESIEIEKDDHHAAGGVNFERAGATFNLSINSKKRERVFHVDGEPYDFTNGFEDLHVQSYRRILKGKGFTLEDAAPAIELCERLSNAS